MTKSIKEKETSAERISPYSDEELEYFRGIILEKRDDAEKELNILQSFFARKHGKFDR